jgi:hypothetical protein
MCGVETIKKKKKKKKKKLHQRSTKTAWFLKDEAIVSWKTEWPITCSAKGNVWKNIGRLSSLQGTHR